jgi:glycine oxidase
MSHDVVIVGGGIVGLSIAYALSRRGIRPTILDQGNFGRETSWAGAGMISPQSDGPRLVAETLRSWSAQLHPLWSARLLV